MVRGFLILMVSIFLVNNSLSQNHYFEYAKTNIKKYNPKRTDLVVIIDYRKNIFSERLFVIDVKKNKVVFSCRVSHAWNSGILTPNSYSNTSGTNKSSKGNYITKGTKYGRFGYSMIIKGLDQNINDNAENRAIIFHSDKKMKTKWSNGCFATSEENNKTIIDLVKNGCLVCVID